MFDYYGLPRDWPGIGEGKKKPFRLGVEIVERAMHEDICATLSSAFDPQRFVPYVQLHEFEALLFCGPKELSEILRVPALESTFEEIVKQFGEPEAIDDDPDTAPSKRLGALAPHFQKVLHGSLTTERIGVARIRLRCPHFADWLAKLKALA